MEGQLQSLSKSTLEAWKAYLNPETATLHQSGDMEDRLRSLSQSMLEAWNAHIIPEDTITIIDDETAALHRPTETAALQQNEETTIGTVEEIIICHLKPLQDVNLHEAILRSVIGDHPRIERYYGVVGSWMVMENASAKTFKDAVEVIKIDRKAIWEVLVQVAEGMQHLHTHDIAHRHLSLDSITFRCLETQKEDPTRGYEAILSDFSRAIKIADTTSEIFSNDLSLKAEDMKDFGFLIWQAFHDGKMPLSITTFEGYAPDLPPAVRTILTDCWKETGRPSFDDAFIARLRTISFEATTSGWSYCSIC